MDLLLMRRRAMLSALEKEEYIVFADPLVEQICATNWGDGVGLKPSQAARVTSIGTTFKDNTGITSFNELQYFTSVTTLVNSAFTGCNNLTSLVLPPNLSVIGSGLCYACTALTSVTCDSPNAIRVNQGAFSGCTNLSNIQFPNSPGLTIWRFAFMGVAITSIDFKIASIAGYQAFQKCTSLTTVNLSSSTLTTTFSPDMISNGTFIGCNNLRTVILPSTCVNVGNGSFSGCTSLQSFTCLSTGASVGRQSFDGCSSLSNLNIRITSFSGLGSFKGCTSLTSLNLSNSTFTTIYDTSSSTGGAFQGCTSLLNVTLPSSCTHIGSYSFKGCTNLTGVTLGGSGFVAVSPNSGSAFENCPLVSFPTERISSVGKKSFWGHKMSYIELNANLSSIGASGFTSSFSNGTNQIVISRNTTPPTLGSANVFYRSGNAINTGIKIYVPYTSDQSVLNAYKGATYWSTYSNYIYELDSSGNIPT